MNPHIRFPLKLLQIILLFMSLVVFALSIYLLVLDLNSLKSAQFVFMGYGICQKGYLCYDLLQETCGYHGMLFSSIKYILFSSLIRKSDKSLSAFDPFKPAFQDSDDIYNRPFPRSTDSSNNIGILIDHESKHTCDGLPPLYIHRCFYS